MFLRAIHTGPKMASGFTGSDVCADYAQVVAGGFEGAFGVATRNEARVVVESCIAFATQAIEHGEQARVLLSETRPHEVDNGDVVSGLASGAESVAEHKAERGFEHCFVSLLEASLFVKARIRWAEASFFSALARKRSICAQSMGWVFSFFIRPQWIRSNQGNPFILPDIFEKGIPAGAARSELL
jgi:hypothetical protein